MKNKDCEEIIHLLSFYIDKELSTEEDMIIRKHLDKCPQCSKEHAVLLELKKKMEEISKEEMEAPEGFTQSVMEMIEEEDLLVKKDGKVYNFFDNFFKKPWIPAVIAAVLLVVVYIPGSLDSLFPSKGAPMETMDEGARYTSKTDGDMVAGSLQNIEETGPQNPPSPGSGPTKDKVMLNERKIIRNGFVSSEVTDYKKVEKEIITETENLGGYVSGSDSSFYGEKQDLLTGNINLRIPEHKFDTMMAFLESKGRTVNKNTSSNDVTEEFFDMNTRINNLRIKEERLLEILSKQGDLKDLLAVEKEIAETRSEIESMEGRLKLLSGQVAFSEVEVRLKEVRNLDDSISKDSVSGMGRKIKESVIKSINMIVDLGVNGIILISSALPFLLILIILYFVIKIFWNKKKRDL